MFNNNEYTRCSKCNWISISNANYCGICGNKLKFDLI